MNDEELKTKEDETSNQQAQVDEKNDVDSKSEEDASKQTIETTDEFDYKDELERAQKKIIKLKKEKKEDVDEDFLVEKVWEKLDEKLSQRDLEVQKITYDKEIQKLSANEDEEKLIKHHLENSIKPTGDIESDVRRAKLLANEGRIIKQNKDLAEALKLRSSATGADIAGQKITEEKDNLTPAEKDFLKKFKPHKEQYIK